MSKSLCLHYDILWHNMTFMLKTWAVPIVPLQQLKVELGNEAENLDMRLGLQMKEKT